MVIITHVRMVGGAGHEHIGEVRWWNPTTGAMGSSSRAVMVDWMLNQNGIVRVTDGTRIVDVRVVQAQPSYLRTWQDGVWTDDLLALPNY